MTTNEARELLNTLTYEQKKKLLFVLASMPSLEDKVKSIEEKLNTKLRI